MKTFIFVDVEWFRTYATDALGFLDDNCVVRVLNDGHNDHQEVPTERYVTCEESK